jgi:predicted GNAT family acetyltransferase
VLVLDRGNLPGAPNSGVRPAAVDDLEALAVAAASMHREEMGVDPYEGEPMGWRNRMATFIERGWSWVWMDSGQVIFKVELSAWTPDVVQLQGVYTSPSHRGRGIATAGLAGVCARLLADVPRCALYVNHYNTVALRLYARLGFTPAGTFATVIYEA